MSICADKDWSMELLKDGSADPVKLSFREVRVVNGILTGRVFDIDDHSSYLRGSCSSFGPIAHMTFVFTALSKTDGYVDIVLSGGGFELPGEQPKFSGRFEVFGGASQAKP